MAIQIGKYKRPGIFTEEFDNSIITSPIVNGINNMVIGVSKKGPVNTPVRITNLNDLETIFGQLDRNLERKGSFFHRTIAKMMESSPVYAVNLLTTDDNLDTIEYKSLSAASSYLNADKKEAPYRRFFDTTGFWKRDTESFIDLTKSDTGYSERLLNFTNLSDRYITVFVFKTKLTGFNRTLIEWYGSVEKMPLYVNQTDYASDYMVDVVVIGGDWSNYQELAVDSRWSQYFNSSGLRKEKVSDFANDRNVTKLAYYEGLSLIPYFRDGNGRNIFIETTINRDTDRTGLFCSFNSDLFETDFPTGLVDLIGNNIVGEDFISIDFLSYKDTIAESITYANVILDRPDNVTAIGATTRNSGLHAYGSGGPDITGTVDNGNRTGWFAEGYVNGVTTFTASVGSASIVKTYNTSGSGATKPYAVIGGEYLVLATSSITINSSSYPISPSGLSYSSAFIIQSTGDIVEVPNLSSASLPTVATSDIVLGYVTFQIQNGNIIGTPSFTNVSVNSSGFRDLSFGTASGDYYITNLGSGSLKIEFMDTANSPNVSNYEQYRRIKYFNRLIDLLDGPSKETMSLVINMTTFEKRSLSDMTISSIVTSSLFNKSFVLNTGLTTADLTDVIGGSLLLYTTDDEFILTEYGLSTKNDAVTTFTGSASDGIAAKYSEFYQDFNDGLINTGDYFWSNILNLTDTVDISFLPGEDAPSGDTSLVGYDYIVFYSPSYTVSLNVYDQISVPASELNKGSFTITGNSGALASDLGFTASGYYAFQVSENVTYEQLFAVSTVYDYLVKHYLRMYLDSNDNLLVKFMDILLESAEPLDLTTNQSISVQSQKSNFKQTVEIEQPSGYTQTPNKVLVNGSRYTEIKVGDFLEAYYNSSDLETGEMPKKLTRILSKRVYSGDTTLVEITCDARIATHTYNGDLQTSRYTTIEDYISTYKAISLKGFRIRQDQLPDGTEARQNSILNLVAKGTPLFKAITNKEALDFRYLIDSFGLGLSERSKQQLVDICGDRLDIFGILNMPSMRSFKNSTSPTFVNAEDVLQTEFIAQGGDPESSPAFLYSFGDGLGTTCTGYFTPYVTISDNGRPISVPPAMFVATTYMKKHISNLTSITPWTISAGVTNGRVTNITGLEINFTPSDIEFLNQAQMNPIVYKRNRGYVIETENTAQTLFKSALSYIHTREVLIELERELSRMLLDFQWKFNTPEIRAEIKLRADVICETFVSRNGLFNYFNKIDEENNTSEIIDNQIGVLDTYVEPIKGMGIIVNNITILRTGAIQSGGFIIP